MIQSIVKDEDILSKKCIKVTSLDQKDGDASIDKIITDLIDTANHYREQKVGCVGLAANQIGYNVRICIVSKGDGNWKVLINPVIISKSKSKHKSTEGCLSVEGTRTVDRYNAIAIAYKDQKTLKIRNERYIKGTAVIVQHEIDHLNGVVV